MSYLCNPRSDHNVTLIEDGRCVACDRDTARAALAAAAEDRAVWFDRIRSLRRRAEHAEGALRQMVVAIEAQANVTRAAVDRIPAEPLPPEETHR